jgi:hypothetical protein
MHRGKAKRSDTDSGPSRAESCRRTFRPIATYRRRSAMSAVRRHQPAASRKKRSFRDGVADGSKRRKAAGRARALDTFSRTDDHGFERARKG